MPVQSTNIKIPYLFLFYLRLFKIKRVLSVVAACMIVISKSTVSGIV